MIFYLLHLLFRLQLLTCATKCVSELNGTPAEGTSFFSLNLRGILLIQTYQKYMLCTFIL